MFSHNDPGRVASAPCWSKWSKLPTYSPEGATLFDLAVVHNGSKLRTAGKVWSVRLSCYHLFTKIRRCNGDESAEKSRKLVQAFWKCVGSQRWPDFVNAVWLINMRTKNAFSFFMYIRFTRHVMIMHGSKNLLNSLPGQSFFPYEKMKRDSFLYLFKSCYSCMTSLSEINRSNCPFILFQHQCQRAQTTCMPAKSMKNNNNWKM